MVFPGSVGAKTSQAVSGELPIWFLFGLGTLCWSNNSSPVVSSGESNLPKSNFWTSGPADQVFGQVPPVSCITDLDGELSVLGYVILDYLFACGYIFLFTSAAGVNVPVSVILQQHCLLHVLCFRGTEVAGFPMIIVTVVIGSGTGLE